ncbi:MAG: hypothetical protein R3F59_30680 [Myxococcota bacterium]
MRRTCASPAPELAFGADTEQRTGRSREAWARRWLDVDAPEGTGARVGAFAQLEARLAAHAREAGCEVGQAWTAPTSRRACTAPGTVRRYAHADRARRQPALRRPRPAITVEPDAGLHQLDEWLAQPSAGSCTTSALGGSLRFQRWRALPAFGGARTDLELLATSGVLQAGHAALSGSARWDHRPRGPRWAAPLLDSGNLGAFGDVVDGTAWWDLPDDQHHVGGPRAPGTPAAALTAGARPVRAAAKAARLAPASGCARLDARKGALTARRAPPEASRLLDGSALGDWVAVQGASRCRYGGPQVTLGVDHRFCHRPDADVACAGPAQAVGTA